MKYKKYIFLAGLIITWFNGIAKNPYVLNGKATQNNCHCYTLTTANTFESGSIWSKNRIDLSKPFDFYFNVF